MEENLFSIHCGFNTWRHGTWKLRFLSRFSSAFRLGNRKNQNDNNTIATCDANYTNERRSDWLKIPETGPIHSPVSRHDPIWVWPGGVNPLESNGRN